MSDVNDLHLAGRLPHDPCDPAATEDCPPQAAVECGAASTNPEQELHLTDLGNAKRFINLHGLDALYVYPWKSWCAFDGIRWVQHAEDAIERWARKVPDDIRAEAVTLYGEVKRLAEQIKNLRKPEQPL